jgi:hypothetical protein
VPEISTVVVGADRVHRHTMDTDGRGSCGIGRDRGGHRTSADVVKRARPGPVGTRRDRS